jgi:hypothetical protein
MRQIFFDHSFCHFTHSRSLKYSLALGGLPGQLLLMQAMPQLLRIRLGGSSDITQPFPERSEGILRRSMNN